MSVRWRAHLAAGIGMAGLALQAAAAELRLPRVFGDHMVLQRDQPVPVWGWANPGERVTVELAPSAGAGQGGRTQAATADAAGRWMVRLDPLAASAEPHTLTVTGATADRTQRAADILIGEVWLCSGQSNMEWPVRSADRFAEEAAAANWPQIRQLDAPNTASGFPQDDLKSGDWNVCASNTVGSFTAVGYFFGRELHRALGVPVGLINASWGGTRIEPWTPPEGFAAVPALEGIRQRVELADPRSAAYKAKLGAYLATVDAWTDKARLALAAASPLDPLPAYPQELAPMNAHQEPCALYNTMIRPLVPFALRGAIWYQGESNHTEGRLYTEKQRALVEGWRAVWGQGAFPFYYVQIAPYEYGSEDPHVLPTFWEAQAAALAVTNSGMVVIHDVGNTRDIHPRNKQEVGRRLALQALARTYGRTDTVWSGPVFASLAAEPGRLRVRFRHAEGGLRTREGQAPTWFEVAGTNTDFVKAEAAIDGDSVLLTATNTPQPLACRFAWHKLAEPNLVNAAGLPAVPFRAGEVPTFDWLAAKVPEAKDYTPVYALDLAKLGGTIAYDEDRHAQAPAFDRVAYFIELQKAGEPLRYLYVSMDAFTADAGKLGIPTAASKAMFQQAVSNLTVLSNLPGITNGAGLVRGQIEFWPHNYTAHNSAGVPKASSQLYDFGDQPCEPRDGYGSMQVHNPEAGQTLFAINQWKGGGAADIGIGNSAGETRDWTFTRNAGSYSVKRLRVLVRPKR